MNKLKTTFTLIVLFSMGLMLASCGSKPKTVKTHQAKELGKEYTSNYVCPMHCKDSGSDKSGQCPVCGMDYELNSDYDRDGQNHDDHDHNHDGHKH